MEVVNDVVIQPRACDKDICDLRKALPVKISGFSGDEALGPEYIPCRIKIPCLPVR